MYTIFNILDLWLLLSNKKEMYFVGKQSQVSYRSNLKNYPAAKAGAATIDHLNYQLQSINEYFLFAMFENWGKCQ